MKTKFKNIAAINYFAFLFLVAATLQGCYVAQPVAQPYPVVQAPPPPPLPPPAWAPAYNNPQVQYYYLPDIEVYYDVWNHEYVYLENGNWLFSSYLPPMYVDYDLYGGHVVILDYRVHQPWMHHELYVSHYPRYYHQSGNSGSGGYPSGYDENSNTHYYGPRTNPSSNGPRSNSQAPNEPHNTNEPRSNSTPANEPRGNSTPANEPRGNSVPPKNEPRTNPAPPKQENGKPSSEPIRENPESQGKPSMPRKQPVQYQGKNVGQPVKVEKNMQKPKQQEIKK